MENQLLVLVLSIFSIVIGIFLGFLGSKHVKKLVVFFAFLVGILLPLFILNLINLNNFSTTTYIIIFVIGCLFAFGASIFFEIGVFVLGGVVSSVLAVLFIILINTEFKFSIENISVAVIVFVIGGILSHFFRKQLLALITSFTASLFVIVGSLLLFTEKPLEVVSFINDQSVLVSISLCTITTIFLLFQLDILDINKILGVFKRKDDKQVDDVEISTQNRNKISANTKDNFFYSADSKQYETTKPNTNNNNLPNIQNKYNSSEHFKLRDKLNNNAQIRNNFLLRKDDIDDEKQNDTKT